MKLLFAVVAASAAGSSVTPVQKVIQMMNSMLEKGKQEKHAEQVQFAAYKQFCDDTTVEKKRDIEEANSQIGVLSADIEKFTATAGKLTKEIARHEQEISDWTGDVKAEARVRAIEKADFDALHTDYSESVDALQRAIAVLKQQAYDRPQALLQLKMLKLIPAEAKRAIDTFLQEPDEGLAVSAPEANSYEFQSSGVIDMLEKLLDKFIAERTNLLKEEANAKHNSEMMRQDLKASLAQGNQDKEEKSVAKAAALQNKADANDDLKATTSTRDADKAYLTDLTALCEQKASDFESRQQLRAEEIVALDKAISIISDSAVAGSAQKHLPTLLQANALAQLRSNSANANQARVVSYLEKRAEALGSRVLSVLAVRVEADPFTKVKKMIKDLIVRLMEEANEEAEHKGWCDTELSTNEQTRKEKTAVVETLHAELDELTASIAKLAQDISDLTTAVAALDEAMAEATSLRAKEKATNKATIKDALEAQTAVAQALTVLKEFYAKSAEATALLQQQPEAPEIFDKPYKGMLAEQGGVVGMLEVIESDFARLEADTRASEAEAQNSHDRFMEDSQLDKAKKSKDIEHKTAKKQDEEQAVTTKKADLEGTQKELDAALAYFDKLKPSCIDAGVSYDGRVARRKEEIESLQEALRILNGEDLA